MKIVVTNDGGDTIATYEVLVVNMDDKILEAWHKVLDGLDLFQCDGCDGWFNPHLKRGGFNQRLERSDEEHLECEDYCGPCLARRANNATLFGADPDVHREPLGRR